MTSDQQPTIAGPSFPDRDPFVVLDKQYEAQRMAETARFDEAQAAVKARIQPALDAAAAEFKRHIDDLDATNLTADQKMQRIRPFNVQHEKARLDIMRTIQSDLDELAAKRKEALTRLESDRAAKRGRLQEIQAMAEKGQINPMAAKRSQFEVLGISLPPAALQTSEAAGNRQGQMDTKDTPPKDPTPKVEAVIAVADDRYCALIGDTLVDEGSMVQGYRVRKIRSDSVEFEKDGKTWLQKVN